MAATKKTYTANYNGQTFTFTSTVQTYAFGIVITMKDADGIWRRGESWLADRRSSLADAEKMMTRYRSKDWGWADLQIVELH